MDTSEIERYAKIFIGRIVAEFFSEISPEKIIENTMSLWKRNVQERENFVIGVGKSAIPMLLGISKFLTVSGGIICTNKEWMNVGKNLEKEFNSVEFIYSSHPLPDESSILAAERIIEAIRREKRVIFLISGGGSSLVELPSISLEDYNAIVSKAIEEGFNIHQLNTIRRYLSEIKGGKILRYSRAKILSLILSDVPGNALEDISSGLTYMETRSNEYFKRLLDRLGFKVAESVLRERVSADEFRRYKVKNLILGGIYSSTSSLKKIIEKFGIPVKVLSNRVEGEAREVGKFFGSLTHLSKSVYIIGGEWDVRINNGKESGVGGPNLEFVVAASTTKSSESLILALGTDGKDGNSPAAGAYAIKNLDMSIAEEALYSHNSYFLLKKMDSLIETGLTGANFADIALLIPDEIFQYLYSSRITFVN